MRLILKLAVNAAALWVAARIIDGISLTDDLLTILFVALVFGLINTFVRPLAKLISLPVLIVTLGLFTFVVNAAMLGLTAWIMDGLSIDGFGSALLGAVVITIVSWFLNAVIPDES
ncbi:MAG TPA: phage holin family protein [Acidimicrobiia bacterium]